MRTAYRLIILFGVGLYLSDLPLTTVPNLIQPLFVLGCSLGLLFALIVTFIIGLFRWRKLSRWWMGPALLCIAFILSFIICGRIEMRLGGDHWLFKRNMVPYVRIVDSIKSGAVPCGSKIANINITNLPSGIRNVAAARCSDGSAVVLFVGKGSSFAGDFGYLYKDYSETNSCIADNIKPDQLGRLNHIIDNWYEFWN
jgi:hypothetical protein